MKLFTKTPLALAVACAVTVHAEDTAELDKQVVTATRTAESLASLPYTVQIIEREDIERQATTGTDIGTILGQLVPALAPGDNTVSSFYQSLRGRSALVLIDGVAQRSNRNISRQLTTISPANIERIEVISGATAIYGAGATGGVINIITKKAAQDGLAFNTDLGFTMSTEDTDSDAFSYSLGQTVSGKFDQLDFNLAVSLEQRGHAIDANGDQIATDPSQTGRDNTDMLDVIFNTGYQLSDSSQIRLSAEYFDEEMDTDYAADYGIPSAATLGLPSGLLGGRGTYDPQPVAGLKLSQQPATERQSVTLDFSESNFFGQQLIAQLNYRETDNYFYPSLGDPLNIVTDWAAVAASSDPSNALLANSRAGARIAQSLIETEVLDMKLALSSDFDLAGHNLSLTYGLDYVQDEGSQTWIEYDYSTWLNSGQNQYQKTGREYQAGPATESETQAVFLQSEFEATDRLTLRAGVRREVVDIDVSDYRAGADEINANFYNSQLQDPVLQALAAASNQTPQQFLQGITALEVQALAQSGLDVSNFLQYSDTVETREGGSKKYGATLFNAGAAFELTAQQQVYLNYGEGFTVPDLTRLLRSISIFSDNGDRGPILESSNVKPITTESWDLGWRGQFDGIEAQASVFLNNSDKTYTFDDTTGVVELFDQEEQIWGVEGLINAYVTDNIVTGGTYAYTDGKTREDGSWKPLPVDRVSPQKITAYIGYQQDALFDVRLQMLNMADSNKAHRKNNPRRNVDFVGYTTFDLLANVALPAGTLGIAVRNLTNKEYQYLYNQVRGYPATGVATDLPALGRTLSLNYSLSY
ncbi:TonB-dependent receptor [Bacterioplanoides sp.]|uniref:TonB-dependent receptor n=1 Tax=Bacterioplanoides sp. TaxID=2066072 RepID=UPI003B004692